MKKIRLLFSFYKGFFLAPLLISIASSALLFVWGMEAFTMIFWYKIATMLIIYSFINSYKRKELFYYQNLGIGKLKLWFFAYSLDFLFFVILISQSQKFSFFSFLLKYRM
jgi:hypothetical protein